MDNNPQNLIETSPDQNVIPPTNIFTELKRVINLKNLIIVTIFILLCVISYVIFWVLLNYPKNLNAEAGRKSVIVQWKNVLKLGFSNYEVYRQETGGINWELLTNTLKENTLEDGTCNQGKKHIYKVKAVNIFGLKSKNAISEEVLCPLRPPSLKTKEGKSSIFLEWDNDTLENFSHYKIYRNINPSGTTDPLKDGIKDKRYQDYNTENALDYYYWIKVFNTEGLESDFSSQTKGQWKAPTPPTNLEVKKIADGTMQLTWSPSPDSDIVGYNVYASTGDTSSGTAKINDKPIVGLSYMDNDVNLNRDIYYYRLKAVDSVGNESTHWSQMVTIKLNPNALEPKFNIVKQPIVVTGLTVERVYENQNLIMVIRWNPVTDPQLSHYEICAPSVSDSCSENGKVVEPYSVFTNEYIHRDFLGEAMFYYVRATYKDGSSSNYTRFWVKRDGASFESAPNVGENLWVD